MPVRRPYVSKSIAELESLYAAAPLDPHLCRQLLDELSHRSTGRANALLRRIEASLRAGMPSSRATPGGGGAAARVTQANVAAVTASNAKFPGPEDQGPPTKVKGISASPVFVERDQPQAILASWIAFEALSPQTYRRPADMANGDQRCVALLQGDDMPWYRNERSRPKQQLFYQVVLGSIPLDRATDALVAVFGENEERNGREREKAPIAAVLLDRTGKLVEENAVAISSFAWALPIALGGDLTALGTWPDVERRLVSALTERLRRQDADGELMPLDYGTLLSAFQWLVGTLHLPPDLIEPPGFAVRVYHYFKSKTPPEVALLNSFYLSDLTKAARAIESGQANEALARYLGLNKVDHSRDLLSDHTAVEHLVAPHRMPAARWPGPGGHPLVTLQQAAVNAIRSEFVGGRQGIAAVNGPPGTGKTTLLRDVVAACVLDRAEAMARFDDPLAAFSTTGEKVAAGDRAFFHLYRLDASLKGHEVLIASSNNKAVENVSKELPSAKSIGRDFNYFRTISDRLLEGQAADGTLPKGESSWGLIAAVLGNAKNRNGFQQAIWWDDDKSLRLYLKAARGEPVFREVRDEQGNIVSREIPSVVTREIPPTPEEARANWKKARHRFQSLKADVEACLQQLEDARQTCLRLAPAMRAVQAAEALRESCAAASDDREREVRATSDILATAQASLDNAMLQERQMLARRPGWFARLLRTAGFRTWRDGYAPLLKARVAAEKELAAAVANKKRAEVLAANAKRELQAAISKALEAARVVSNVQARIHDFRRELGPRLVDSEFFERGHEHWNLSAPWIPDSLHEKREDLFSAALQVHRAFIDVAAQKFSHNLGALMSAMQAGAFHESEKRALLPDLWSTLFIVVPAVSTTFASVERMLGDLPASSIGWLLVDEAGQATPQSAVGAMLRSKRVIVVGDPLQVPPVVALPERLVLEVCKYFKVSPQEWAAPDASVQTVADEASHYQAEFKADSGTRRVGLPLLVHRRCLEPMFGISNRIAYDGQMVHAAQAKESPIATVLGPSAWINVDGSASTKWCQAEGDVVVRMLHELASAGLQQPDLYIITPFRIVAHELRRQLQTHRHILERLQVDPDDWITDRVGTIHTFQGKEAEAVIAILGAPMAEQQGARRWACGTPNILNVLVSRAKSRLYVVGSRAAWGGVGHAREMAAALATRRI